MTQSTRFPQLVGTSTSKLELELGGDTVTDTPQVTTNASILLNEILCGHNDHNDHNDHLYGKLDLSCFSISNGVFCSICSAVAELSAQSRLSNLSMDMRDQDRWQWLIYGLCCGASNTDIPSVEVLWGTLTKSDISIIADVLRVGYPLPAPKQECAYGIYGFVNLQAGVEVHLCDFLDDEHAVIMIPISCRCRAVYDPNNGNELVNFVVPGYGACVAKLGGAVQFTPDSTPNFRVKPLRGSLALMYITIETPEVLLDLLTMITSGLRALKLYGHHKYTATQIHLDLCALATACPKLRELSTDSIDVVVSSHNNALRQWPIKYMELNVIQQVSDLLPCLGDPTTRMAHELVELRVSIQWREPFDDEEVKKLKAHNGEFLPVVKEKFPLPLKIAMISAVTSTFSKAKAIQRMNADLLSGIFVLASTPEQRVIECLEW
ncbi:hypothetical protein PHMEG_00032368 [Phytophthora megakarya]|uniref:Uncharacterized protein n=1 Tax=Phytophthora megakarya TaxID=4795 RepID=A0A225UWH7_9STRA|nr:hypothetical protein PHMEG_00032368 [Phytophthora megakarya]